MHAMDRVDGVWRSAPAAFAFVLLIFDGGASTERQRQF